MSKSLPVRNVSVVNIFVAAATAASIERAETTGEVEATGPVVEVRSDCYLLSTYHYSQDNTNWKPNLTYQDKDVSKKTLRNRKKRSMKKQRLLKKQQQAKAGGPELTEAEVRVAPVIAFLRFLTYALMYP